MTEEKEKPLGVVKKKKKYVYLDRYEQNSDIINTRLEHLENMNMVHWAFKILIIVALTISFMN